MHTKIFCKKLRLRGEFEGFSCHKRGWATGGLGKLGLKLGPTLEKAPLEIPNPSRAKVQDPGNVLGFRYVVAIQFEELEKLALFG